MKRGTYFTAGRERGAVLITALMILLLMTIFGISSMDTNILEERMAGNMRDRNVALQAAEAALRAAEKWLADSSDVSAGVHAGVKIWNLREPDPGSTDDPPTNDADPWWFESDRDEAWWALNGVQVAVQIDGVAAQPSYIIERLPSHPVSGELGQDQSAADAYLQITARGVGQSSNTVVMLQSIYKW